MRKIILVTMLALLILPLALAGPAYASGLYGDQVVVGDNFTLHAGETISGDLVVVGGNVTIEDGATVAGNVVVIGGNVDIAGAVDRDVVVFGGNVTLISTAVVSGELATVGGTTTRDPGAQVKGGERQGFGGGVSFPRIFLPERFRVLDPVFFLVRGVFNVTFSAVAMGLLALVVVLFWPDQTARVSAAATTAPVASGGLGLLTLIAVPTLLIAATVLTLFCLSPLTFVGALIFAAAIIFGWLALGMLVGARLTAALNLRNLSPAVSAGIGTLLFTLVANAIGWIVPCVGWVVPVMLGAVGLGAVTLTRFGTRPYLSGLPPQPTQPTPPPPAPDAGEATMAS